MSVELFGERWIFTIALAPVSSQARMGEVATARVSRATENLQIHSTFSPRAIEKVNEAYDGAVWFQLYAADKWQTTLKMIRRTETAGYKVLVFAVDVLGGSNRELADCYRRLDK